MTELPDDELDKLFRKSEELNPDYEPEDWNALKKRLDQHDDIMPAGRLRKWWPLGLLGLFISVAVAVYFLTDNKGSDTEPKSITARTTDGPEKSDVIKPENQESAANGQQRAGNERIRVTPMQGNREQYESFAKEIKGTDRKTAEDKTIKILPRSRSKTGGVYLEPNRSERKGGDGAFSLTDSNTAREVGKLGKIIIPDAAGNRVKRVSENPDFVKTEVQESPDEKAGEINRISKSRFSNSGEYEKAGNKILPAMPLSPKTGTLVWNNVMQLPVINISGNSDSESPVSAAAVGETGLEPSRGENNLSEIPQWAVRFGYSPDLSTVGFKNFSKPGAAVSLLFEYAMLSGLYVQTGVIGSVKAYSANASEYELSKYVTQIATPETIDGTCHMLEIPFGFRYDLLQTNRSRWFAGAGFSSFYVQKEKYIYNYSKYIHGARPGWEGKTGWFWLSHLNVSAGYEHRISRKLSLLAEPYIKIPLKGLGYGKVDLTTLGMWLSVRYTPVFK
jgi:hypothetical protein